MKRKIFSIFLTLVLVCSFSLVTAVPAAAQATTWYVYDNGVDLVTGDDGTATWVATPVNTGDHSAKLEIPTPYIASDVARVMAPYSGNLTSISSLSYYYYVDASTPETASIYDGYIKGNATVEPSEGGYAAAYGAPYLVIELDAGGDTAADTWVIQAQITSTSSGGYQQDTIDLGVSPFHVVTILPGYTAPFFIGTDWGNLTEVKAASLIHANEPAILLGGATVLKVKVAVGEWNPAQGPTGPVVNFIDSLEINGATLDLEPGVIQEAIDAADPDDTIIVAAGTYNERVNINKSLTLEGANAGIPGSGTRDPESIINPQGLALDFGVLIYGADTIATFDGFTVENYRRVGILAGSYSIGQVDYPNPSVVHILNNIVKEPIGQHNNNCIQVGFGTTGTIIGNEVMGANLESPDWSGSGILVSCSSDVLVSNNYVHDCEGGIQIMGWPVSAPTEESPPMGPAEDNFVENNLVEGNKSGIVAQQNAIGTIVRYNDVLNNARGIVSVGYFNSPGYFPSGTQIHYNNIEGNADYGVRSYAWDDGEPEQVDAENNWWGTVNGPTHEDNTFNVGEQGNAVSDSVVFVPWHDTDMAGTSFAPVKNVTDEPDSLFSSIQAAIDAGTTDPSDTINVAAGTYTEHLTIAAKSNLTIQSTEDAKIVPTSTPWKTPIIKVASSTDITIRGLVIDGKNEVDPSSYSWGATATGVGIVFIDSTGTIEGNEIRNFKLHSYPVERRWKPIGTGIVVTDNCSQVTIEDNAIKSYQASGIRLFYGADADIINIIDNVITGIGAQSWYSGESIRIDANGTVNIIGNELRDNIYNDEYGAEGEATGVTICGVCGLPVVNITENDILNNTFGIMVEKAEGAVVEAHFNNIIGNGVAGTAPNRGGAAAQDVLEGHGDPDVWPINTTLNATYNWWGHASGPSHELTNGKWVGKGDKVSGNVDYKPWLHKSKEKIVPTKKPAYAQSVDLDKTGDYGWNTFSAPIFLDEEADTWAELYDLADELDYSVAYRFDSDNQTFVNLETGDDYDITPGEGFFIKMDDVGSLTILYSTEENLVPPSRPLTAGWNLIGLANLEDMDVDVAFASIAEAPGLAGYSQVVSPTGNVNSGAVLADGTIYVGESYWVYMLGARTLAGFSLTPVDWVP